MKLYLVTLLVFSSLVFYKAQGTRPGQDDFSAGKDEDILKVSSAKGSIQDDQLLSKSAKVSPGINRRLMTKFNSASTTTIDSENQKNKDDSKAQVISTHQLLGKEETSNSSRNSKHWKKDVEQYYADAIADINEKDYTPARKKSPIHN